MNNLTRKVLELGRHGDSEGMVTRKELEIRRHGDQKTLGLERAVGESRDFSRESRVSMGKIRSSGGEKSEVRRESS